MKIVSYLIAFYLLIIVLSGCGSVHIQTGPPTGEDARKSAEIRGSSIKTQFAETLRNAAPQVQMDIVRHLIDSTAARYLRFGDLFADEWDKGNFGRGELISATEIQQLIENSTRDEQPIFEAYDEMIDYGIEQIELTLFFNRKLVELLVDLRSKYEAVVSVVLYPNRTLIEYREDLVNSRLEVEKISSYLTDELISVR